MSEAPVPYDRELFELVTVYHPQLVYHLDDGAPVPYAPHWANEAVLGSGQDSARRAPDW